MICQSKSCGCKLVESNLPVIHDQGWYIQRYYCFECNILYVCFSDNKNMTKGKLMQLDNDEY